MRHNIVLEGMAFRLRPITEADASLIIALRSDTEYSKYLHPISTSLEEQKKWLRDYDERPDDYYFVVERTDNQHAEGLISLYAVDRHEKQAEWGRWILIPGSLAAVESVWLIYQFAFEHLCLDRVYCRTVADNQAVLSFHDSCGLIRCGELDHYFQMRGQSVDAVEHAIDWDLWQQIKPRLAHLAALTARRLKRV